MIRLTVYLMCCTKCGTVQRKNRNNKEHACLLNYTGSLRCMESTVALDLIIKLNEAFKGSI